MNAESIHFTGHPCFKTGWSGFDRFLPCNVVIGKNNVGKSYLLDLVQSSCEGPLHKGSTVRVRGRFDEKGLKHVFPDQATNSALPGWLWPNHGEYFVGKSFEVVFGADGTVTDFSLPDTEALKVGLSPARPEWIQARMSFLRELTQYIKWPLTGRHFRRLRADRDIRPEPASPNLHLEPDGSGATNIIRRFLTTSHPKYPRDLVHRVLLNGINEVFGPEGKFIELVAREHDEQSEGVNVLHAWEIYLAQEGKGLVSLTRSGSGLKTVILVLLRLLVMPHVEQQSPGNFVFAFEELENNLHPSMLRRLLRYVETFGRTHGCILFFTTHSSTALDLFGVSSTAQIIHVTHDGKSARASTVSGHFERYGIVAELGARPSDLLQANGVVWVEGPSDRLYLSHWIDLMSGGRLKDGRDYAFAFYGGALLAQAQFTSPEEADTELTNLLRVNPNVIVLSDSDRTSEGENLKNRVTRILSEVAKIPKAYAWVTGCKEIENYIPAIAMQKAFKDESLLPPEQFERFFPSRSSSGIPNYVEDSLKLKHIDKIELAAVVTPMMTVENMRPRFDWEQQVTNIVRCIDDWNS